MITIIKDGQELRCSKNTYDTMYKRMGYEILGQGEKIVETIEIKEEITKEPEVKKTEALKEKAKGKNVMPKESIKKVKTTRSRNKKGE